MLDNNQPGFDGCGAVQLHSEERSVTTSSPDCVLHDNIEAGRRAGSIRKKSDDVGEVPVHFIRNQRAVIPWHRQTYSDNNNVTTAEDH